MIFQPEQAKLIRSGKKTQTRRVVTSPTCRYQAGKSYAVQPGRGKPEICRVTVMGVRRELVSDITLKDARREGFVTRDEFFAAWPIDRDLEVWVISFVLGDQTDTLRLLARTPGAPHGDYVAQPHLALDGEPEAVSAADTAFYAKVGHARDAERAKDPDIALRDGLIRELERWRDETQGATDRERRRHIDGIARQVAALDRKLKAA